MGAHECQKPNRARTRDLSLWAATTVPPPRDRGGYWAVGMPLAPRRFPSGGRAQVFSTQSPPRRKDIRR